MSYIVIISKLLVLGLQNLVPLSLDLVLFIVLIFSLSPSIKLTKGITLLLLYVDDMIIARNDLTTFIISNIILVKNLK